MKKVKCLPLLVLSFMFFVAPNALSTDSGEGLLVSTDWLEENLDNPSLVILYIGKKDDFDNEHIPNSRIISMRELIVDREDGTRHELPDADKLQSAFRSVGINNDSKIIICYAEEMLIPLAARLFYTLDYAGIGDQSAILNGGLTQWKEEGRQLTSETSSFDPGNFEISPNQIIANKELVFRNLENPDVLIIDARPEEQYDGSEEDPNSPRKGHIVGAVNIPFYTLQEEENPNLFKNKDEIKNLFHELGAENVSSIIIYCGSGIWSSPVYFAARYLGYNVKMYDASFQEWGSDESLPITSQVKLDSIK